MRIRSALVFLAVCLLSACSGPRNFFRAYEYEEEMYLSLDGTATLYVNSSVAALNALRGTSLDANPEKLPEKRDLETYYSSPNVEVTRITFSSRNNRRYIHVRMSVKDVSKLGESAPFNWSTYSFKRDGNLYNFRQEVGKAAGKDVGDIWKGDEIIAFRMHLPSKIVYHNAGANNLLRGNILVWEQEYAARVVSSPLTIDARMETQSILYRTIALFGATFVVVAVMFVGILWWVVRRAKATKKAG